MMFKNVQRFDATRIDKAEITEQGYLLVDAYATRTGIFEYYREDGTVYRELRPEGEVFKEESLRTLATAVLTDDHPNQPLTPENTARYQVGNLIEKPTRDSDKIKIKVSVTDASTIKKITTDGKRELSCGYYCDVEPQKGIFDGKEYDAIQKNIRYNHVSLVDYGRAGPEVRINMDSMDSVMTKKNERNFLADSKISVDVSNEDSSSQNQRRLMKIKIDGVEYEASEDVASATLKMDSKLVELNKQKETMAGEIEALKKENTKLIEDSSDAVIERKAAEIARVRKDIADAGIKIDGIEGMGLNAMKKAAVADFYFKGDSDKVKDYSADKIDGMFEVLATQKKDASDDIKNSSADLPKPILTADDIRQKRIDEQKKNHTLGVK